MPAYSDVGEVLLHNGAPEGLGTRVVVYSSWSGVYQQDVMHYFYWGLDLLEAYAQNLHASCAQMAREMRARL